jgi:FkbM family methyltransferase
MAAEAQGWRDQAKSALNSIARMFGARIVGADWGPQGVSAALRRAKTRGFSPGTVIDVGASNGQWTRECQAVFPDAHYLMIDPLETNQPALAAMAEKSTRVSVWNGALGAGPGNLSLHCHGDQSSFFPSKDFSGSERAVEVRTLDSLLESGTWPAPLLIKADVQGYELEVLKGAERCLENAELLLLELSFRRYYEGGVLAHDVVSFLGERKFCIYDICTYIQRPADNELVHADLMFVRRDSQLVAREGWY